MDTAGDRGHLVPVIALALAAVACGSSGVETSVAVRPIAPVALERALAEGRPARAIVLLDDAPAQAAAAQDGALEEALTAVVEGTKDSLLAESSAEELLVVHRYGHLPALHVELRSPHALRMARLA